ncbi:hypothetical protein AN958_09129, partial [Leucoagaricus sp. SymC.cos]
LLRSLHVLNSRLVDSPTLVNTLPSAALSSASHLWSIYMESRWNQELAYLFAGVREWNRRASEWGQKAFYGKKRRVTDLRLHQEDRCPRHVEASN